MIFSNFNEACSWHTNCSLCKSILSSNDLIWNYDKLIIRRSNQQVCIDKNTLQILNAEDIITFHANPQASFLYPEKQEVQFECPNCQGSGFSFIVQCDFNQQKVVQIKGTFDYMFIPSLEDDNEEYFIQNHYDENTLTYESPLETDIKLPTTLTLDFDNPYNTLNRVKKLIPFA